MGGPMYMATCAPAHDHGECHFALRGRLLDHGLYRRQRKIYLRLCEEVFAPTLAKAPLLIESFVDGGLVADDGFANLGHQQPGHVLQTACDLYGTRT